MEPAEAILLHQIDVPVFKPELEIRILPPDFIFFRNEFHCDVIQSHLICKIASLINGRNSTKTIAGKLRRKIPEMELFSALFLLEEAGYIIDARSIVPAHDLPDASLTKINAPEFSLNVTSAGGIDPSGFLDTLKHYGSIVSGTAPIHVLITPDYLHPDVEEFHKQSIRNQRKWIIVRPASSGIWIGPLFDGTGACWNCLSIRLKERLGTHSLFHAHKSQIRILQKPRKEITDELLKLSAVELSKHLKHPNALANTISILNLSDAVREVHPVMKLEHCPDCCLHSSKDVKPRVVRLSKLKVKQSDGGYRSIPAAATLQKYEQHIDPLTGIVTDLKWNRYDRSGTIFSYVAKHLFAPVSDVKDFLHRSLHPKSAGKGISAHQAKASALCEALERYSGVFRGNESRIQSAFNEIADCAYHVEQLLCFSEKQYQNRAVLNRSNSRYDQIPARLKRTKKIEWTPAWSLTSNRFKYVPTAYCYYGYPSGDEKFCIADSNGNAAGNTIEEAILQGFLELVERDATALWWLNRISREEIDFESFDLPYFRKLKKYYNSQGCKVWALDITSDFQIPVIAAIAMQGENSSARLIAGFGAHFDPAIAAGRALTEMNQFLPGLLSRKVLPRKIEPLNFLLPSNFRKSYEIFPAPKIKDISEAVERCVQIAASKGLETIVVNQTRADVGLTVVKVIVPGMRHFRKRFGPGRLFEVPLKLKWLRKPHPENRLNADSFLI